MEKVSVIPDIIASTLADAGVENVFHLPGTSVSSIYPSLARQKKIKSVLFKHEQAACFAAAGYALMTNRPGVCMVMCGPGVTNIVSAVTECYYQSIPVVVITVDNPQKNLGIEAFHEVDSFRMLESVTKKIIYPEKASDVQKAVADAIATSNRGRPGPVYLNIPIDIMEGTAENKKISIDVKQKMATPPEITKALKMIYEAESPMIFAGSGIIRSGAEADLAEFTKLTGIPVLMSLGGRGALPDDNPLSLGMPPYNFDSSIFNAADLFIVLGARLNPVNLRMGKLKLPKKIIRIDVDDENPKFRKVDIYIKADAGSFLRGASEVIRKNSSRFAPKRFRNLNNGYKEAYNEFLSAERKKAFAGNGTLSSSPLTSRMFLAELSEFIEKNDAVIFTDTIWTPYSHLFPRLKKPRSFFSVRSFGCLGFALPAAIGATFAKNEKRKIISLSGDGGFLFNCQDLSTAATYNRKNFIQIILNNSGYSSLNVLASAKFGKQDDYYLWNKIDYSKLSESFGVNAIKVEKRSAIKEALSTAFSSNSPCLINVMTKDSNL